MYISRMSFVILENLNYLPILSKYKKVPIIHVIFIVVVPSTQREPPGY